MQTSTATFGSRATALARLVPERRVDRREVPWWKRALDIALVLAILPTVLLISLVIAVYIKLVSRGPVFFAQDRVGHGGKVFRLLKFRTMRDDGNGEMHQRHLTKLMRSNRPMQKLDTAGDSRIIPLGRVLRSSGLDELPQLFNVLRGEMSLVGPRPCMPYEYDLYESWHKERVSVLPGLTGMWQVNGKNRTTFEEMMRLDIAYARTLSFGQDLKIIAQTIPALLTQMQDQWDARSSGSSRAIATAPARAQAESA